ncbi:MAG: DUF4923 family protein [Dinghuibacter sp.]|nr:DUF4923 family protein [Dinghuibacter sp.]
MKKMTFLLGVFLFTVFYGSAQNTVVGNWKPLRIVAPGLGEIPVEEGPLREYVYRKTLEDKNGAPLTAEDSSDMEALVMQVSSQFGTMTMTFNANKTYTAQLEGKSVTGRYVYNPAKKLLTTYPKGKPARTAKVAFKNGEMMLENTKEKVTIILERF